MRDRGHPRGRLTLKMRFTLVAAGAVCHVPAHREPTKEEFPLLGQERVKVVAGVDLADEGAVERFYRGCRRCGGRCRRPGGLRWRGWRRRRRGTFGR